MTPRVTSICEMGGADECDLGLWAGGGGGLRLLGVTGIWWHKWGGGDKEWEKESERERGRDEVREVGAEKEGEREI